MPSITSLLKQLRVDYPQFSFCQGDCFQWSPSEKTIFYCTTTDNQPVLLLHELSHALLDHATYTSDIQLITMEREAWDYAVRLAPSYKVSMPTKFIESTLDSYRDWIHDRSTCPNCTATGLQINKSNYKCPACSHSWRVNEARTCALRRYAINK